MKLNKEILLKTEFGSSLKECITAWDKALTEKAKYPYNSEWYKRAYNVAFWCQAQWEVYKIALREFFNVDYYFTRTDEYYGLATEDESDWLFKITYIMHKC